MPWAILDLDESDFVNGCVFTSSQIRIHQKNFDETFRCENLVIPPNDNAKIKLNCGLNGTKTKLKIKVRSIVLI